MGSAILCNNISSGSKWVRKRAECFSEGDSEFREGVFRVPAKVTLHTPSRTQKAFSKSSAPLPPHSLPEMISQNRRRIRKTARLEVFPSLFSSNSEMEVSQQNDGDTALLHMVSVLPPALPDNYAEGSPHPSTLPPADTLPASR